MTCSEWRNQFNAQIAERDSRAREKHERILAEAKDQLDKFYAEYNEKKAKGIARNKREAESAKTEGTETPSGTLINKNVWERVSKLIEQTGSASVKDAKLKEKLGAKENKKEGDKKQSQVKGKETARMKEVIQSLKKEPKSPGNKLADSF